MKRNFFKHFYGIIAIATTSIGFSQTQLQNWSIPPNSINFTTGSPVTSLLPSSGSLGGYYNTASALNGTSIASNSMHDSNGNLLFFVTQDAFDNGYLKVFDKNGNLLGNGSLKYNYSYTVYVGAGSGTVGTPTPSTTLGYQFLNWAKEISIIPVPGNCNQFYLVAGFQDEHNLSGAIAYQPVYAKIDLSIGVNGQVVPVTSTSNLKVFGSLAGMPAGAFQPYAPNHKHRFGIAATPYRPEVANKNYFLYIYSAYNSTTATGFFKYQVNASGISFFGLESPSATYPAGSYSNYYSEMEIVRLPTGNYRMARVFEDNNIYYCDLDYINGSIITGTEKTINFTPGKSIEGLEFSPDGNYLYYSYHGSINKVGFLANLSSGSIPVPNDWMNYNVGFIEMAYDSKIYFNVYPGDHLMSKSVPNLPGSGMWVTSATTLNADYAGGYSTSLPDQLDGNIYYKTSPKVTGNTNPCMSSASYIYTLGGSYDPTVNYTWTIIGGTPSTYYGTSQTLAITWTASVGSISVQVDCSIPTTLSIATIPSVLNPDFVLSGATIAGNTTDYRITATPVITPPAFWWEVSEINLTSGLVIAVTTVTNNQTWWYSPFIVSNTFPGYDYSAPTAPLATGYSTSAPYATPPYTSTSFPVLNPGKFHLGHKYRITRATWGSCAPWTTMSKTIYLCTGCKNSTGEPFIVEEDQYSPSMPQDLGVATNIQFEKSTKLSGFNISPNPTNGSFNLSMLNENEKDVFVYDMVGKLVYNKLNTLGQNLKIDLTNLPNGLYIVNMVSDGTIYSQKIIKQD